MLSWRSLMHAKQHRLRNAAWREESSMEWLSEIFSGGKVRAKPQNQMSLFTERAALKSM